ncbi:hypothetical protein BCR33DRAFT_182401 [Rhizoclosmatium globosum]|uniref:Uncharacterized protein n=1 Tax=Rhizoclosmatium globosum TaxID=329046 RepID=A0A1Y2D1G2_9FUNG|nr:hypothetical protein BCR33DRAFT_182401 [Rhizoclosmatium globosum]|eukprot:ORY52954.1 hypothetical protein BCR33DRAFT_182401 [Rhizoclosmatium globosum]
MESLTSMLEGLGTGSPGEVRGRSVKVTTKTTTTTRSVSRKNVITKVTVVTETTVVNSMDLPFIPLPGIKTRTSKAVSVLNDHTDILVYDETAFDLTDAEREIIGCIQTPDCSSNFMELTAKLETEVMNYIIQTPEDQDPESVDSRERLIHYQQAIVAIKLDIAESLGKDYYFNYAKHSFKTW